MWGKLQAYLEELPWNIEYLPHLEILHEQLHCRVPCCLSQHVQGHLASRCLSQLQWIGLATFLTWGPLTWHCVYKVLWGLSKLLWNPYLSLIFPHSNPAWWISMKVFWSLFYSIRIPCSHNPFCSYCSHLIEWHTLFQISVAYFNKQITMHEEICLIQHFIYCCTCISPPFPTLGGNLLFSKSYFFIQLVFTCGHWVY